MLRNEVTCPKCGLKRKHIVTDIAKDFSTAICLCKCGEEFKVKRKRHYLYTLKLSDRWVVI